jgi:hypothetical protein
MQRLQGTSGVNTMTPEFAWEGNLKREHRLLPLNQNNVISEVN